MSLLIQNLIDEHIVVVEKLKHQIGIIEDIATLMITTIKKGGKIVFFGNGGSCSQCQHLTAELVGKFKLERRALPAIALTTNTSIITAIANDLDFCDIFSRQVDALVTEKDLVIGISTSGRSINVFNGIFAAKRKGAKVVTLTGGDGGVIAKISDITFIVPSDNTPRIQEAHILIGHIICELVEKAFADA